MIDTVILVLFSWCGRNHCLALGACELCEAPLVRRGPKIRGFGVTVGKTPWCPAWEDAKASSAGSGARCVGGRQRFPRGGIARLKSPGPLSSCSRSTPLLRRCVTFLSQACSEEKPSGFLLLKFIPLITLKVAF